MPTPEFQAAVRREARRRHASLAVDLARLREDAGVSRTRLAAEAGVDRRYLDRIEAGTERPSIETYQRLAAALGRTSAPGSTPTPGRRSATGTRRGCWS